MTTTASSTPATRNDAGGVTASPHGHTTIAEGVVAKVADLAAREVRGVHDLVGGVGGTLRRMTGRDHRGAGATVEVGLKEAAVDLNLVVEYGVSIPQVIDAVRANVTDRIVYTTGLSVKEINVEVSGLHFADEDRRGGERETRDGPRVE